MKLHLHISDELGAALLEEELKSVPAGFAERVRANPLRSSEMIKLAIERRLSAAGATPIERAIYETKETPDAE